MSKQTAADILVDTLIAWKVDTIFGLPGDGNNGILEALRQKQDKIHLIVVRHEESAAFMASAYAKYTGRLGVCLSTGAPGAIHLLNGLYDAKVDRQPVLAITGNQFHDLMQTHGQQDVNLDNLFADLTVYNARIMGASHVEPATNLAIRHALAQRGVSHLTFPKDLQSQLVEEDRASMRNYPHHTSQVMAEGDHQANPLAIQKAADLLNAGGKIAILAGQGALDAGDLLEQVAEILGAPIIKALLGKAAVPDHSPYTTGTIGYLGTEPSHTVVQNLDTLLMVGTNFPYMEYMPHPAQARAVQIDLDPTRIGIRYPVEVGLVGDSRKTLQKLLPLLKRKEDRTFLTQAQEGMQQWWKLMEKRGTAQTLPMKPQVVAWELGKQLTSTAIVSCDSGSITHWWARQIKAQKGQMFSISGNNGSMACSLPYTLAAQIAHPDRQCVAFAGDGGFSMLMGEFSTAVKYNLPIKVVVFKNNKYSAITWEQKILLGNPEFATEISPIDFVAFAEACGAKGYRIANPATVADILRQALAEPGPVIIEAVVDPDEMPHAPSMTPKEFVRKS